MLNAFPLRPDQELLPEALRTAAPRPVRYVPWVKNTRLAMLNGWIVALLLLQWLVPQANREMAITTALLGTAVLIALECHFRYRFYLLSRGEATVGVVVSREITKNRDGQPFHKIRYCYWTRTGKMRDDSISVSEGDYHQYQAGFPITVLYDSRFWITSLPLFLVGEVEIIPQ